MVPSPVGASGIRATSSGPTTRGAVFASPKSKPWRRFDIGTSIVAENKSRLLYNEAGG